MNHLFVSFSFLLLLISGSGCQPKLYTGDCIITDASIVDVESLKILEHKTLIITNGKIENIIPFSKNHEYKAGTIVNGQGTFIIPCLWDMHTHYVTASSNKNFKFLFTANGVLGVRELWGNLRNRDSILLQEQWAPRIFLSGAIFDGPFSLLGGTLQPKNESEAIRFVDSLHQAGADFIKVYDHLSADIYNAIVKRCKELQLPFAGHTPDEITALEASEYGQKSIEHLNGIFESCSSQQDSINKLENQFKEAFMQRDIPAALNAFTTINSLYTSSFNNSELEKLATVLKKNETHITPTLTVLQKHWFRNKIDYTKSPSTKYVPKTMLDQWDPKNEFPSNLFTDITWKSGQDMFETGKRITKLLHDKQVMILAGSDCGVSYVIPGFSLHEELALLVESGLSNGEALQTATLNPAKYFNATDSLGTISKNKIADLVLLRNNPLDKISNTTSIIGVMKQGKYLDRKKLDELLKSSEISN